MASRVLQKSAGNRTNSFRPLTKDDVKAFVASGLQRRVLETGIETVAGELGCTSKTVRSALAHDSLLEADKLGNLMAIDPSVFSEWFKALGLRVDFYNTAMSPDMQTVSQMSRAVASFIDILEDGHRDHRETVALANILRPLMPRLAAIVHEAEETCKPRIVA